MMTMLKVLVVLAVALVVVASALSAAEETNEVEPTKGEEGKFFPKLLSHIFDILNFRKVVGELKVGKSSPAMCFVCKFGVALLQHFVETGRPRDQIADIAFTVCATLRLDSDRVCRGIVDLLKDEMMYVFSRSPLGPQETCGVLLGSECARVHSPLHNWTVPLDHLPPKPPPTNDQQQEDEQPVQVLQLSDTHLDPWYSEGSVAACGELLCCRGPPSPDPSLAAGRWGDYRACDTPLRTLLSMLDHIRNTHTKIAYVMWTGDIPPHDVWNSTRSEQSRLLRRVSRLLAERLPGVPVYPALGNHESERINSFPGRDAPKRFSINWLHEEVAKAWGRWLPPQALTTLKEGMYYAVQVNPGLKLISLNMNYCNSQNWWMLLNSTDPGSELRWLVEQLAEAELKGQKVHIMGHIPPGHSDCLPVWSDNYHRIINRFEGVVQGQFFGHSHLDELEVFYEEGGRATSVAYVGPSVTPYDGLNPAYRIYHMHPTSAAVLDHETHILNLTEANASSERGGRWRRSYSARTLYGLPSLQPHDWDALLRRMDADDHLFHTFHRNLYHLSDFPREPCDGACKQETLCRLRTARSHHPPC